MMWNVECGVTRGGFLIRTCLRSSLDNNGRGVVPSYYDEEVDRTVEERCETAKGSVFG